MYTGVNCICSTSLLTLHHNTCLVCSKYLGKSTALRCALSICGQHNTGHIMKTKATSDSIIMERVANSTLPFGLDDPKSSEDIGELLIQLCNGGLSGNMKVGLRKPKSIPILCCNFNLQHIGRQVLLSKCVLHNNESIFCS